MDLIILFIKASVVLLVLAIAPYPALVSPVKTTPSYFFAKAIT
jgi:hypothetical protein